MQPSGALQYEGNNFDGAVLPGRPQLPAGLPTPEEMMRLAVSQPAEPEEGRESCELVLLISSAAGYERRRQAIRATYLTLLRSDNDASPLSPEQRRSIRYRFLLGAPKPEQAEALSAEQEEHGDLLQVAVPESYESLWPKLVACWRWAHATYDFRFWMHADDDSFIRFELLLRYLGAPETPARGLYAGYIWDGSEGRRTAPLRDPTAKSYAAYQPISAAHRHHRAPAPPPPPPSQPPTIPTSTSAIPSSPSLPPRYMPVEQWPHPYYPPFASGCGFVISHDLVAWLVSESAAFTFFRVIDVPVGLAPRLQGPSALLVGAAPTRLPAGAKGLGPPPGKPRSAASAARKLAVASAARLLSLRRPALAARRQQASTSRSCPSAMRGCTSSISRRCARTGRCRSFARTRSCSTTCSPRSSASSSTRRTAAPSPSPTRRATTGSRRCTTSSSAPR
jgi:galactosylxylosylprotein 3-beta-galactosyltransferase